jgi:puromycin-sensitive aminopeptidase
VETAEAITLNALEIEVRRAEIRTGGKTLPARVEYDLPSQRISLHPAEPVEAGPVTLELDFAGILNDQLHGFYRSTFTDVEGNPQVIATTQFEATDARRAFPCFDEPDMKASFGVTLVVDADLLAVSNSAEARRSPASGGKVAITYADTMTMSTYLVAFVVGPFEATQTEDVDGVPLRVVFPKGKAHLAGFAMECGRFCLRYLRDYYGIPYPGDKVDLVAIPDFAFGAMENLGCVTFRESALLVDTATATQGELLRILDVVAHELAHMWFGDLVTMGWWNGIWLNEAFATFMEMKASDAMRPDWKRWLTFGAVERPWAFGVDALHTTRPVEFEVSSPEEANEMFDALTYGKGSSVLRMIEQHLGEDVFRRGVGNYLRAHAYANTVTADLWAGLDEASGLAVGGIMDTWILQGGFPQLEVDSVDGGLRVQQRRFLTIPDETDQTLWKIPVHIRGESGGAPFEVRFLLDRPDAMVPMTGPIDWAIANAGGHGFYRVAYGPGLAKALVTALNRLDDLERYVVVDDAWAFVEAGRLSAAAFLELATAYRHEGEQAVWQAVLTALGAVRHHLVDDAHLAAYRDVVRDLVTPTAERLGWQPEPGEADLTRRLRGLVLGAMGRLAEDPGTIERSRTVAEGWLQDPRTVDPDVAQASIFTYAAHGSDNEYERLFDRYRSTPNPQDELKLLQALTLIDRTEAVDRTLAAVLDGGIRSQDAAWVVGRLFHGRYSGPHAWQKVRLQWSAITAAMPPATLRRMPEGLPALSQPPTAADVAAFFAETPVPIAAKTLAQNIERMQANARLRGRESEALGRWLEES